MSSPAILLIEACDGLGAHEADAALRMLAMRRAGVTARLLALEPADGESLADAARAAFARSGAGPRSEVWIASGDAAFRAIERALPPETSCRWWPTLVPGCGGEPGGDVPDRGRDAVLALGPCAALDLAPVRSSRDRTAVAIWDGEFVLAPGPLRGAEGERLLRAFATAAEERPALELVVLCDPDTALMDVARRLGVGWRVHCAGISPREAEHTWIATAAALLLPGSPRVAAGLVLRVLAAGTPIIVDAAAPETRALVDWLGTHGVSHEQPVAAALEAALENAPRVRIAREDGRALAARHEPDALAPRLAAAFGRNLRGREAA